PGGPGRPAEAAMLTAVRTAWRERARRDRRRPGCTGSYAFHADGQIAAGRHARAPERPLPVQPRLVHHRPTLGIPGERQHLELGPSAVPGIVGVEDQPVPAVEGVGAVVPRAGPAGGAAQDFGGAALVHAPAVAVEVGTGEGARAADHDPVVALRATAAVVVR